MKSKDSSAVEICSERMTSLWGGVGAWSGRPGGPRTPGLWASPRAASQTGWGGAWSQSSSGESRSSVS